MAARIVDVLDPRFLQAQLERAQAAGERPLPEQQFRAAMAECERAKARIPPLSAAAAGAGEPALVARPAAVSRPDAAFFAREASTSILQSTLETCILSRFDELTEPASDEILANPHLPDFQLKPGVDIYRRFGPCDAGWIRSKLAEGWRLFNRPPPFPDRPAGTVELGEDACLVMVSDWGQASQAPVSSASR